MGSHDRRAARREPAGALVNFIARLLVRRPQGADAARLGAPMPMGPPKSPRSGKSLRHPEDAPAKRTRLRFVLEAPVFL